MEPSPCWQCQRTVDPATRSCGWCGVWVSDLDPAAVPSELAAILSLARRWGIADDGLRWDAVAAASAEELDELVSAVDAVGDALDDWLVGPAADEPATAEYVALTCLTLASDQAQVR